MYTEVIRNRNGGVVYMAGLLPSGEYGIVADEIRPFTDEELADKSKFLEHKSDLDRRIDASFNNQ